MADRNATSLLGLMRIPTYFLIMLGFAFFFFDVQYFVMARLPGEMDLMCVVGAGLTMENILFAIVLSLLAGLFVAGLIRTLTDRSSSLGAISVSSIGALIGTLSVFCVPCAIPVISLFGISLGLSFFTDFNIWFKIISLILILIGLYQIDRQLKGKCERCVE